MRIKNLTMTYGNHTVFENVNMIINDGEHIGVVGMNGAGKTTFFKIIMGLEEASYGKIIFKNNTRIDWLPQIIAEDETTKEMNTFDYLLKGRPIEKLNKELEELYYQLGIKENNQNEIFTKINKVEDLLNYYDQYNADSILLKIIDGINITEEMLSKKIKELSGGQKSKVAFARLLYSKPEIILLDEPTNHLDEESKTFITNYLKNYKGSVYIISHDETFLNEVTSKTLYLDKRTKNFKLYDGNYSYFKKMQKIEEENLERQLEQQNREEEKLKSIVLKYTNSSGKRKRMAQDREKKLEKLLKEKVHIELPNKQVNFDIELNRESGNIPIKVENLSFKYNKDDNEYLLEDLNFSLYKGEKFLVVGENGVGKSTLLKLITGVLTPNTGEIVIGNKTDIGYYAQELDGLNLNMNIMDNFKDLNVNEKSLRKVLGRFLFNGDEVFKKVGVLSPGERARVALAKLSITKSNFLVLDEPTNHLDPETQELIANVFKDFKGTMIVVSHNPNFVDKLGCDRTIILPEGIISYYNKGIVEYYKNLNEKK